MNTSRGKQTSNLDDKNSFLLFPTAAYYFLSEAIGIIKILPATLGEQIVKNLSSITEVIITTRAVDKNKLIYSSSNVYYIEGVNQSQYQETPQIPQIDATEWLWTYRIP